LFHIAIWLTGVDLPSPVIYHNIVVFYLSVIFTGRISLQEVHNQFSLIVSSCCYLFRIAGWLTQHVPRNGSIISDIPILLYQPPLHDMQKITMSVQQITHSSSSSCLVDSQE